MPHHPLHYVELTYFLAFAVALVMLWWSSHHRRVTWRRTKRFLNRQTTQIYTGGGKPSSDVLLTSQKSRHC